ncbi:tRNA 2-thiouridine(34) synthase MnmA [Tepidanaerobacter syntrophicus]|uniref:tRNA 2-thiouridine(34) synthase MnmA n=1 Tax=Tepidanaerobacter syntrophicus TaxID=224999 RepID=UPI001BD261C8|nr:tRNA 2-thiouridine(34) synthase MnmA [Tepidanaerobacter syntrophicus]
MNKNKVAVAMSGGVDSSVCAYLLKEQGYEVIGITMQIFDDASGESKAKEGSCSTEAVQDARLVAKNLGIPHYVVNLKHCFNEKVIKYFISEYLSGKTPNPCIVCNKYLKFTELLKEAFKLDAFYLATGHYARVEYDDALSRYILKKSVDSDKDQSYVLYGLTQQQLEHVLFPLGNYTKKEIRRIAQKIGLSVSDKPDSQEICFIDTNYRDFLYKKAPDKIKEGPFIDTNGKVIGKHKGIPFYTIGQRKGLGISAGKPLYVVDIDAENNAVVLGDEKDLYTKEFVASQTNWVSIDTPCEKFNANVKIRYNFIEKPAEIILLNGDTVKVIFENPQKAVTPGQSAVFYKGDVVLGGGVIQRRCLPEKSF